MKNIFIIGTGRSGTHFLCRSLLGFENVEDYQSGQENHDIRIQLTKLAIKHQKLTDNIIEYYESMILKAENDNKIFLDQLHTNLFHVDQLIDLFPNSLFLATERPKEQIVASMLNHGGVRKWFKYCLKHRDVAFPNRFLGIGTREELQSTPIHLLCSKRVDAHVIETQRIKEKYPENIKIVKFSEMVQGQELYFKNLFTKEELILLGNYNHKEIANLDTLDKFKRTLNTNQLKEILS